jgi:Fungal Zn(2)-Cys(6) binuclear cluster domain
MSSRVDENETAAREHQPRKPKRTRVQLACQRYKIRKQKCDGSQPECSTCARLEVECRYIVPSAPKPQEAKLYTRALENRVAELETALTNSGLADAGLDHWAQGPRKQQIEGGEDGQEYSLLAAVRDVSLNTSGSFIGGTSNITLARILESILG